jgi:hypothetical protein
MPINSHLQQHEMRLQTIYPSGAQEWFCPTCSRRFIVQWQPTPNIIDLEVGAQHVSHTGSTGDFNLRPPRIRQTKNEDPVLSDELRAALEDVLEDIDLDDWLNAAA